MIKIVVTHSSDITWKEEFYNSLRKLIEDNKCEIIFPQEEGKRIIITKEIIKNYDLVIAEVSFPSTGQGIELGWADIYGKSILCLYKEGRNYSGALKYITDKFIEYKDSEDIFYKLAEFIKTGNK